MNTKIIAVVVAAVIILAAGGYFILGKNSAPNQTSTVASPTPSKGESMKESLINLLTSGKTQMCNFSYKGSETESTKGTIYLTADKMRGNITNVSANNKTTVTYIVRNGDTTYIWGEENTGIKVNVSAQDLKTDDNVNQYFNTDQNVDYSCDSWIVDDSMFKVPTNIKFLDVSAMMPQKTETKSNVDFSICDQLTGEAQTACKNSMQK